MTMRVYRITDHTLGVVRGVALALGSCEEAADRHLGHALANALTMIAEHVEPESKPPPLDSHGRSVHVGDEILVEGAWWPVVDFQGDQVVFELGGSRRHVMPANVLVSRCGTMATVDHDRYVASVQSLFHTASIQLDELADAFESELSPRRQPPVEIEKARHEARLLRSYAGIVDSEAVNRALRAAATRGVEVVRRRTARVEEGSDCFPQAYLALGEMPGAVRDAVAGKTGDFALGKIVDRPVRLAVQAAAGRVYRWTKAHVRRKKTMFDEALVERAVFDEERS